MPTTLLSSVQSPSSSKITDSIFAAGQGAEFREKFTRQSFLCSHNLVGNPLFELPRLTALAETLLKKEGPSAIRWKNANAPVDARWGQLPPGEQIKSVSEAVYNLDKSGSWVLLYRAQQDPEYGAILEKTIDEVAEMIGKPLRDEISWKDTYIFLGSPHAITPYHIDHETTFLFQVHGDREAHFWDQNDRSVLTDQEIEEYYLGNFGAGTYRQENQAKARIYNLVAGKAVYQPVLSPHYYQNGDSYSVAIGVHLDLKSFDRKARAYQVNGLLRSMGIKPTSPGISPWRDELKIRALQLLDKKKCTNKYDVIRSGAMRVRNAGQACKALLKKPFKR